MTTYSFTATEQKNAQNIVAGPGEANNLKVLLCSTVELTASATAVTIDFGQIPSNARISGASRVYNDDCATSGAPLLDLGLASDDITNDPDALGNGLVTLTTATVVGTPVIDDAANIGKEAYSLVSGQATDPKNPLTVYGTLNGAATTQTGTVTVEILGYLN